MWLKKTIKLFPKLKYDLIWCDTDNFPEYYGHLKHINGKTTIEKYENDKGKLDIKFVIKHFNEYYVQYKKWKDVHDETVAICDDFNKNVSPSKMIEMYISIDEKYKMYRAGIIFWKKSGNAKVNITRSLDTKKKKELLQLVKNHLIEYDLKCKIERDSIKIG